MNITFRLGTTNDIRRLAEIDGMGDPVDQEASEKQLPVFIEQGHLLCAEAEGEIVGLLYWTEKFFTRDNWYLTAITIDKPWRAKGLGEKFWRYFLNLAKEHGAHHVFADIREGNLISQHLAEKIGGKKVGSLDLGYDNIKQFYRFDLL